MKNDQHLHFPSVISTLMSSPTISSVSSVFSANLTLVPLWNDGRRATIDDWVDGPRPTVNDLRILPEQTFTLERFNNISNAVYDAANIGRIWQLVREGTHTEAPAPTLHEIIHPTQYSSKPLPDEAVPEYDDVVPIQYLPKLPTDHPGDGWMLNHPQGH